MMHLLSRLWGRFTPLPLRRVTPGRCLFFLFLKAKPAATSGVTHIRALCVCVCVCVCEWEKERDSRQSAPGSPPHLMNGAGFNYRRCCPVHSSARCNVSIKAARKGRGGGGYTERTASWEPKTAREQRRRRRNGFDLSSGGSGAVLGHEWAQVTHSCGSSATIWTQHLVTSIRGADRHTRPASGPPRKTHYITVFILWYVLCRSGFAHFFLVVNCRQGLVCQLEDIFLNSDLNDF